MPTITALSKGKGKRLQVFLDGRLAFTIGQEVGVGLGVGQELSLDQIQQLSGRDLYQRCYEAALRLLGYRARSGAELKGRLLRRFPGEAVEKALSKLREQELIDDARFAQLWAEGRQRARPRSASLIRRELIAKGVAPEMAAEATAGLEEAAAALRAGRRLLPRLASLDYPHFRLKLSNFLHRRGFGWEVVRQTVNQLWAERASPGL